MNVFVFAWFSGLRLSWRLIYRGHKVHIAPTAPTTLCNNKLRAVFGQIHQNFTGVGIAHNRAGWNLDDFIATRCPAHLTAHAMAALACTNMFSVVNIKERREPFVRLKYYITA